jgi:hypothetical protein
MEAGYVLDRKYGGYQEERWNPGDLQPHWWGVARSKSALPVVTMRCPKCGALESYAPASGSES